MAPSSETLEPSEETLREVVFHLAAMHRPPCSEGEREAAEWIAMRLRAAGADQAEVEDAPSWGSFPPLITCLSLFSALGAALSLKGRRGKGAAISALALAGYIDEIQNGPRLFRRALKRKRTTANVVAKAGDPEATATLVIAAHHDAAQTGFMFDQTAVAAFHKRFPTVIPHIKTQPPQWWGALGGPVLGLLGAITGRRGLAKAGLVLGLGGAVVVGDMWRSETVPGANDNLTAVGVQVAIAEMLREQPIPGLRVWFVSAGAEETLQDGIRGFFERHGDELDPASTWYLNLDTVGSPRLMMLEGEGPVWMEDYDKGFRDRLMELADEKGLALERGFRARASPDAVIAHRAGIRTANLSSVNDYHNLSNYHLPSDTAENVDYSTVVEATRVAWALAEDLASTE
ncbi:M28 family metallopeptidase [soil metagenome]